MSTVSSTASTSPTTRNSMSVRLSGWAPEALGVLRIITALLFIEHGTQKLIGFPAGPMGTVPLLSFFGFGGTLEVVGGLLVLLGIWTRPVAFVLSGQMAVAYWMFHAPMGVYPVNNTGDAAILFCFVFLYLVFSGPGAFSLSKQT